MSSSLAKGLENFSFALSFSPTEDKRQPTEGCLSHLRRSEVEQPRDGGAWWAAVYGVTQSRTLLKRLSSSSSSAQTEQTHM